MPPNNPERRRLLQAAAALAASPLLKACSSLLPEPAASAAPTAFRRLGGLSVAPVGLGCQWLPYPNDAGRISDVYGSSLLKSEAVRLIQNAVAGGVTLIDTAEAYGPFVSEEVVGEALRGSLRERVTLCSKFGWNIDLSTGKNMGGVNSRPEHIRASVELMLRRLKTDHIDLLYQHRVDPNIPIEDVAGTVAGLVSQGKVRYFGLSEAGIQTIRRAHTELPLAAVQNEYSVWYREPEHELLPLCAELNIGLVCWSPLGGGFLGGNIDTERRFDRTPTVDIRSSRPRYTPENLRANQSLRRLLQQWAARKNATPAQISLAWILSRQNFTVPIPGTTQAAHLAENIAAAQLVFSREEWQAFNRELDSITIHGDRLPESSARYVGIEAPPK